MALQKRALRAPRQNRKQKCQGKLDDYLGGMKEICLLMAVDEITWFVIIARSDNRVEFGILYFLALGVRNAPKAKIGRKKKVSSRTG